MKDAANHTDNAPTPYGSRDGDDFHGPRYVNGQRAHYRRVQVQHWIGGRGYVTRTEYNAWNPAKCGPLQAKAGGDGMPEDASKIVHFHSREDFERFTDDEPETEPLTERARRLIEEAGPEAVVCFVKRTTGKLRTMRCRARKGGGRFKFDPAEKGLLPVVDLDKDGPRFVPLDAVRWVLGSEAGDGTRREAA